MKIVMLFLAALLLCSCSTNQLRITGYGLLLADWQQTRNMDHSRFVEHNPILGKHPSKQRADLYFGSALLGVAAADHLLEETWRRWLLMGVILLEGAAVGNNISVGAKF